YGDAPEDPTRAHCLPPSPSGGAHFTGFSADQSRIPRSPALRGLGSELEPNFLKLAVFELHAERLRLESVDLARDVVVSIRQLAERERRAPFRHSVQLDVHSVGLRE